jgi:hypothetical protein
MREELGLVRSIRDINLLEIEDHFLGNGVADGAIGDYEWRETNSAAGTNTIQAGALDHPGIVRLVTGAVSGNNKRLHLGVTASEATFTPTAFDRFRWVVRIPTITTLTVRLGLMQDVSAASGGTAGAYFEFDPSGSANWRSVTRQAGVSTGPSDTGVPVLANSWFMLEGVRRPDGAWVFAVNGTQRTTHVANQPTTACAFGALCQTGAAAARNLDLDYCYVRAVLGQLWT